jgi:hypothetical protein
MDLFEHFNIYCDESCHLENDHQKVMILGAVWCATEKVREISIRIREKKIQYGLKAGFEIKWPINADAVLLGTASLLLLRMADELFNTVSAIFR